MKIIVSKIHILFLSLCVFFVHCNAQDANTTDPYGPELELLKTSYTTDIFQDSKGVMWFGTINDGLIRFENDEFKYLEKKDGLAGKSVRDIQEDQNGNLWLATDGGVSVYNGETFTNYDEATLLISNDINCVTIDSKGVVWIGSSLGISRYVNGNFHVFQLPNSRKIEQKENLSIAVHSVTEDSAGNIWFGTEQGIWKFDMDASESGEKPFANFTSEDGLSDNTVLDILEDSQGDFWFATKNGGVCQLKDNAFKRMTTQKDERTPTGWSLYKSSDGTVYFPVNGQSVYQYSSGEMGDFIPAASCYSHTITCILEAYDGTFWLAGWSGIFKVK